MANFDNKKEAKRLYADGMTFERIAKELNVSTRTLSKRKKCDGNWEFRRATRRRADLETQAIHFLSEIMNEFGNALKDTKNDEEISTAQRVNTLCDLSMGFARAVNANDKLMPSVNQYAIAENTIVQLSAHICAHKPELMTDFSEILDDFLVNLKLDDRI